MSRRLSRRHVVAGAGALALAACDRTAKSATALPSAPVDSLKALAPFPLGVCAQIAHLNDPSWVSLATRHFSQITAEWEMKMEYIVLPDGSLRFDRPDQFAAFCAANGMRLFGHTLIWYSQTPEPFEKLTDQAAFEKAYDDYIHTVVGRYKGRAVAWDVVNEAVAEQGDGYRECMWSTRLGQIDYMRRAFDKAHEADPDALLLINEYNLEHIPKKLDSYLRLIETLLKAGAPLSAIGCQTHTSAAVAPGKIRAAIKAIGAFGLPIHMSELDVSLIEDKPQLFTSHEELLRNHARVYAEAVEAFGELPAKQRFALTLWGLRDKDSYLVQQNAGDAPMLFDDQGQAKAVASTFAGALKAIPR